MRDETKARVIVGILFVIVVASNIGSLYAARASDFLNGTNGAVMTDPTNIWLDDLAPIAPIPQWPKIVSVMLSGVTMLYVIHNIGNKTEES